MDIDMSLQAQTRDDQELPDREWVYHITTSYSASLIKDGGISSALARTGVARANPNGAFAQDRDKNAPKKILEKLRAYTVWLATAGYSVEAALKHGNMPVPEVDFVPSLDTGKDLNRIDEIDKKCFNEFVKALSQKEAPGTKHTPKVRSKPVESDAMRLKQAQKHALVRLAEQYTTWYYRIEEKASASFIYFTVPRFASAAFSKYKQQWPSQKVVVLRVKRTDVPDLQQDLSEFMAERTMSTVSATLVQIMDPADHFGDLAHRCEDRNWRSLLEWNPPPP